MSNYRYFLCGLALAIFAASGSFAASSKAIYEKSNSEMKFFMIRNVHGIDSTIWVLADTYLYGLDRHFNLKEKYYSHDFGRDSINPDITDAARFIVKAGYDKTIIFNMDGTFEKNGNKWEKKDYLPDTTDLHAALRLGSGKVAFITEDSIIIYDPFQEKFSGCSLVNSPSPGNYGENIAVIGDTI